MNLQAFRHDGWYGVMMEPYLNIDSWQFAAIATWCRKTFGLPYSRDEDDGQTRWRDQLYDGVIYFRDEADRTLFLMRWGN